MANPFAQQRSLEQLTKAFAAIANSVDRDNSDPYGADWATTQQNFSFTPTGATRPDETPQNMLQQSQGIDFEQLDQLRSRNNADFQGLNNLGNRNQDQALQRRIRVDNNQASNQRTNTQQQTNLSDSSYQNRLNADFNQAVQMANLERKQQPITATTSTSSWSTSNEALRMKAERDAARMADARQRNASLRQQQAQQQAQERLARIGQQTDIMRGAFGMFGGGNPGESNWRWF